MLLLDTNVISELRKARHPRTDPNFVSWAKTLAWSDLYLSAMSIQEMEEGASRLEKKDPVKGMHLGRWLNDQVLKKFSDRILSVDVAVAVRSGRLQAQRTYEVEDAMIAATAFVHRMTLVTRNTAHFHDSGIELLNPWLQGNN